MIGVYHITEKIKEVADSDGFINVVTFGDIFDVDLNKQSLFPLLHIMYNQTTIGTKTTTMDFTLLCMDVVDDKNAEDIRDTLEPFFETTNEQDVLNATLNFLNNIVAQFRRGDAYDSFYEVNSDVIATPFRERFTNLLAGHSLDFSITVLNEQKVC